jgi:chromate transporter
MGAKECAMDNPEPPTEAKEAPITTPTLKEALSVWWRIGFISFGGPAAQIALIHEEIVNRRQWIDERSFLTALNFCMLLPGPEAQQLATYLGLKLHGLKGALAAGIIFILPGAAVLFALAWLSAAQRGWPPLDAAFSGMLPIAVALVILALHRISKRTLTTPLNWALATGAFLGLTIFQIGFPWIVVTAMLIGIVAAKVGIAPAESGHGRVENVGSIQPIVWPKEARRIAITTATFLLCGATPVAIALALFGTQPFGTVAAFFTQAAFVTFGGAYAVLPFVAEHAVDTHQWLSHAEMVHGLALAETTPGPLILVTQYVGFFAGWNAALAGTAGDLSPLAAGSIAAGITTWVTFLPSFWFIIIGAPLVEHVARNKSAAAALAGVSAAVVGVIASLALSIAEVALWPEQKLDVVALVVVGVALLAASRFKLSALWLVLGGAALGVVRRLLF